MVADRINKIAISPTMKISARAKAMQAEGIDIINFNVGEPDFPTPQKIKDAAKKAIDNNYTKYTVNDGMLELRVAIADKLKKENDLDYNANEIIVTNGAKQSVYNVIFSLINEGDEVIIPAPYWVSYPEMVKLAKGIPVFVNTKEENGFKLTTEELKNAITNNTKAFIICNPCNPTGSVYSYNELKALADVLEKEDIYIISDEIYEKLIFNDIKFSSFASLSPKIKSKTLVINGVSKAFSMTGWRLGYTAGPREIIEACSKIQGHCTSNASTVSQHAALEALTGSGNEVEIMVNEFRKRRDFVVEKLNEIPGISCIKSEGAFYVFPNVSFYFGKEYNGTYIRNSYGLSYYLLKEAKVAVVPGAAFGIENYLRISYSTSIENLKEGIERIKKALLQLKVPKKIKYYELSNTITKIKKPVAFESSVSLSRINAFVAEAESYLNYDNSFEWNASIGGSIVKLKTNIPHLYDFWMENWYPAQLKDDLKPDGIIYAIDGVTGRDAHTFYNSNTNTGILFNTDFYGSLRSLAFGLVTDLAQKMFNVSAIRGMSADYNGHGFVLMGPRGSKKTEIFYGLIKNDSLALHSSDLIFVSSDDGKIISENPERKIYIPTNTSAIIPVLSELFDRSKCENVNTKAEECESLGCQQEGSCIMDTGLPYCYNSSPESYAMLDPYWIGGMHKHIKKIQLNSVFIMKNSPDAPVIKKLEKQYAIDLLEKGIKPSDKTQKHIPFYNSHLIVDSIQKIEQQKKFFSHLFDKVDCYGVNINNASIEEIQNGIITLLSKI